MRKKIFKIAFLPVIAALLIAPALYAKKESGKVNLKGFSAFVEKIRQEWGIPGCAVAIVKDGKVVFARGFGCRDVENKLPVTADTLFAIGSNTKTFTATILGILVDQGKMAWEKPVQRYLPGFRLQDPVASRLMTPVDLLTHRSGLPRHDTVWYKSSTSRQELINRLAYLEPSASFRSTFQYNNLMFVAAGYMAGKIAGTSWEELVRQHIFAPLGMKTSNFSVNDSQKAADFSFPYSERDGKVVKIPFRILDNAGPAGSINSSVNEMANWLLLNLNKGKFRGKQVISAKNLQKLHSPQIIGRSTLGRDDEILYSLYGMGWGIMIYRGNPIIAHSGGIDGFISWMAFLPKYNAGIVILTNKDRNGRNVTSIVSKNVYDRILRLPLVPWAERIRKRAAESRKRAEEYWKKNKEERTTGTKPSHKLADYCGEFENPGYGIITIRKDGDILKAEYNDIYADLKGEHYHYDTFEFTAAANKGRKFKATFHTDIKGNINKLSIPFQPGVKDIEFTRLPEKKK